MQSLSKSGKSGETPEVQPGEAVCHAWSAQHGAQHLHVFSAPQRTLYLKLHHWLGLQRRHTVDIEALDPEPTTTAVSVAVLSLFLSLSVSKHVFQRARSSYQHCPTTSYPQTLAGAQVACMHELLALGTCFRSASIFANAVAFASASADSTCA